MITKLVITYLLLLINCVFARYTALFEAFSDHVNYFKSRMASYDKHFVYTIIRGCLWFSFCLTIWVMSKDWIMALCHSGLTMVIMLLQYRFIHDGYYHLGRNQLNPNVSPNRFFQDGDGLSSSKIDQFFGDRYRDRHIGFIFSCVLLLVLIFFIINNI